MNCSILVNVAEQLDVLVEGDVDVVDDALRDEGRVPLHRAFIGKFVDVNVDVVLEKGAYTVKLPQLVYRLRDLCKNGHRRVRVLVRIKILHELSLGQANVVVEAVVSRVVQKSGQQAGRDREHFPLQEFQDRRYGESLGILLQYFGRTVDQISGIQEGRAKVVGMRKIVSLLDSATHVRAASQARFRVAVNFRADPRWPCVRILQDVRDQIEQIVPSLQDLSVHFVQRLHFRYAEVIVVDVEEIAEIIEDSCSQ